LEILYQGQTKEVAVRLARHFQEAGHPGKAVVYLTQAGDAASRVYANAEAIAHYSQAIELVRMMDGDTEELTLLYTHLGRALELDSQFDRVLTTYEAMEKLAQQRGDRAMELASLQGQTTIQAVPTAVHDPECALVLGKRALILAGEMADRTAEARILWSLSLAHCFTNRLSQSIDCGERSLALARELGLREQRAQTLNDLGSMVYLYSGRISQAKKALQEAGDLWRSLGNTPMLADSLSSSCIAHVYAGDYERAIALSEQALEISQEIENLWGKAYSRWTIGDAYRERGEYSRAIEASETCIRLGEMAGFLAAQTYTRSRLAAVYGDLGALERAFEQIELVLSVAETRDYRIDSAPTFGALAHLYVLKGDFAQAESAIDQGKEVALRESWAVFYLPVLEAEAELALRQGDQDRALAVTADWIGHLREYGMRLGLPVALHLKGQALLGSGERDAARTCLLDARKEAERQGSRRALWPILYTLAQVADDTVTADSLRRRACKTVRTIASQIHEDSLRASFLNQSSVRSVLGTIEPE
jgi:tetratricopeptide (TPR) repeat protein